MKIKKFLLSATSLASATNFALFSVVSCSKANNEDILKNSIKNKLEKIISNNKNEFSIKNVSVKITDTSSVNLFNIFSNPALASTVFDFNANLLDVDSNLEINYDFDFNSVDSWGNAFYPTLSSDKTKITIPLLVSAFDNNSGIYVSKYINLFDLYIEDTIINDGSNPKYEGSQAKEIVFKKTSALESTKFRPVPREMIDKYLNFIVVSTDSRAMSKEPIYQHTNEDLQEWKGKTLSEVMSISNAIKNPTDFYDGRYSYSYSILNSFFYGPEREYAYFVMKISLNSQQFPELIEDAQKIYGLSFEKEYTVYVDKWKFAKPNSSDINSYIENNKKLMEPLLEIAKTNVFLYTPEVIINPEYAKILGASELVSRFNRGTKDFKEPRSFVFTSNNGQTREISFLIESLETIDSNEDLVKINISMIIDKDDLSASNTFSKNYNVKSKKFQ